MVGLAGGDTTALPSTVPVGLTGVIGIATRDLSPVHIRRMVCDARDDALVVAQGPSGEWRYRVWCDVTDEILEGIDAAS